MNIDMRIVVDNNDKKIRISVKKTNLLTRFTGLMFKPRRTSNLLFYFDKERRWSIHSFFVFFDFLALWLDKSNNVIEWRIVSPFRFFVVPAKPFRKLVEIPINRRNKDLIDFFVGKRKV